MLRRPTKMDEEGASGKSLYRQRVAQRGAKLRARRAAYREPKPRKSDDQREAERAASGQLTLRERRGNLPSYKQIRRLLTHVDGFGRGYYLAEEAFGVVLLSETQEPPENGETVLLRPTHDNDAPPIAFTLYTIERVGKKMFSVGTPEALD